MRASDYVRANEDMAEAAFRFLREHVLTEENTDTAIEWGKKKLSGVKLWIIPLPVAAIAAVLDKMLPEKLLDMILHIMVEKKLVSARRLAEGNPFAQ